MFWNQHCKKLVKKLWIPKLSIKHIPSKRKYFKCQHSKISFNYFSDGNKTYDNLKFKEITIKNNTKEKEKLNNQLYNKEVRRLIKEVCKNKDKPENEIIDKHFHFLEKIETKVNNLDGHIRSNRIQILPNENQKTILSNWFYETTCVYNKLVSHFTQVYQHFKSITNKPYELAKSLKSNNIFPLNFYKLRALKIKEYCEDYFSTPYCIIADTIKEFVSNVKSNITNIFEGYITEFEFKHRKYNRICFSLPLESHYTNKDGPLKRISTKSIFLSRRLQGDLIHQFLKK